MLVLWPVHELEAEHSQYPGIMNLSAVLKEAGYRSEVVPMDLSVLGDRLRGEDRVVAAFSTPSALAATYVGFNRKLKRHRPDITSVFGGPHPTYFPNLVEEDGVDAVCIGEGEYALLDFVRALEEGRSPVAIPNWWVKQNGAIHRNPPRDLLQDLDELPLPDREAFLQATKSTELHAIVMTGRGCPYQCTYCCNHLYQKIYAGKGKLVRRRSVDHVMRELKQLKDSGFRFIRFMDDLFILQQEWVTEFSDRYSEEIGLPFSCLVRANFVTERVVSDLKRAGCHRIMMGIEAGNDRIRNEVMKRRMSDSEILEAARIIKASGIRLVTANIFAVPGGTLADDWETVDLNIKAKPNYASAAIMIPFLGTEIYETAKSLGLLEENHVLSLSDGGFGLSSTLKMADPMEARQIANLQKFFPLLVWMPWLKPLARRLIRLPPNRIFDLMYLACVHIGVHFISVAPSVGWHMLLKKLRQRFISRKRPSAVDTGAVDP